MESKDNIAKLEEMYRTQSVNVITDITSSPIDDVELRQYLSEKNYNWLTVLNSGEILFNFETDIDSKSEKVEAINNVASMLLKRGLTPVPRPCSVTVIQYLLSLNAKTSNVKKSHQNLNLVTDNTVEEQHERTEVQHLLDNIIDAAAQAGTSDIHIETDEQNNVAVFRFRVDGNLTVQTATALKLTERMAIKLGSMIIGHEAHTGGGSTSDTFDKNRPINGSFTVKTQKRSVKLRYSHLPIAEPKGLSIVMRIVTGDGKGTVPTFYDLQYSHSEIALLERIFRYPQGIILFTGPTGSGKSSAMAAGTTIIPKTTKIISFEDPVESKLPNVCQVQIGNNEYTSYAAYARTVLRQDPDVIIYGEIRDEIVMQSAIDQANTGHLVLSTLHTNTPADAIARLISLGSDLSTLSHGSLIRALVGQRLVGKLCPECKVKLTDSINLDTTTSDQKRVYAHFSKNFPDQLNSIYTKNLSAKKCINCKGVGEKGRLPLVEIIMVDQIGRDFIKELNIKGWLEYLRKKGWRDLTEKAIARIIDGSVCPLSAESTLDSHFGINTVEFDYEEFDKNSSTYLQ